MKSLLACLLCFFCTCVNAQEGEVDETSQIIAGYVTNWNMTRTTSADCTNSEGHHFVLGNCPSTSSVDLFYLASVITHLGVKSVLPESVGKYFGGSNLNVNAYINPEANSNISLSMSF